jgi:hypothetical protein
MILSNVVYVFVQILYPHHKFLNKIFDEDTKMSIKSLWKHTPINYAINDSST